jgi:hypothetical protein
MSFRITGLPSEAFADIFTLSDGDLAARREVRRIDNNAVPCRISLTDAGPGDEVVLINYVNHPVETPYRSSYAIYVREGEQTYDEIDQVPEQLRCRMLSIRAYDETGMIVGAELVDGRELEALISKLFTDEQIAYLHVHFAKFGCYAARVDRA